MDRAVVITGLGLVLLGLGVFGWKAFGLDLPVVPDREPGIWEAELEIAIRGTGEEGSVRAALPSDGPGQRVFGEHFASDRLRLTVRDEDEARTAVWRGVIDDVHRVYYGFKLQLFPVERALLDEPYVEPDPAIRERYGSATMGIPASAPAIQEQLDALDLPPLEDIGARVRAIFAFARHEIADAESSSDDALLTLSQRAGSALGRERLLASLLRSAEVPARLAQGLDLRETRPRPLRWVEAWVNGRWMPLSASAGFFGTLPEDTVKLASHDRPLVRGAGIRALGYSFSTRREQLSAEELATLMLPASPILRTLSLYRLPIPMQSALRVLLLFCASTVVVSLLRNGVGLPSFGTFMPALLALALRVTGLVDGLVLIVVVMLVGILGRLVLERLRLLFVPRLSILVCIVVLAVAGLGLAGRRMEQTALFGGVVLPVVILTMLIERFSIVMVEEGIQEALMRGVWSVVIAVTVLPVLRSQTLEHLLFAFPELIAVVMGLQVWIGGYTGYRLSELRRFSVFRRVGAAS